MVGLRSLVGQLFAIAVNINCNRSVDTVQTTFCQRIGKKETFAIRKRPGVIGKVIPNRRADVTRGREWSGTINGMKKLIFFQGDWGLLGNNDEQSIVMPLVIVFVLAVMALVVTFIVPVLLVAMVTAMTETMAAMVTIAGQCYHRHS